MTTVRPGLERLLGDIPAILTDVRIGLLTNPSGVNRDVQSTLNLLLATDHLKIAALFGPEHGIRGEAQAGDHVAHSVDARSGLPVYSLHGDTRSPTPEMLDGIDVLVIDVQDIGVRYATYLSTLANVLDACASFGPQVVILDRPNPLGGSMVSGNLLDPAFASFVGIHRIPTVHGLTIGEFGLLWARDHGISPPTVIAMEGWKRRMRFDETGLPWIFPSPNLPTLDSVIAYPATCLFEGTNLSEGRGTTRPFELFGAPWIAPEAMAEELNGLGLAGVRFRPVYFTPSFSKHQGVRCGGVQAHIHNRDAFDSVELGPRLLDAVRRLYPDDFAWLPPHQGAWFVDKLAGGTALRETIDRGSPLEPLLEAWREDAAAFRRERSDILLYDD